MIPLGSALGVGRVDPEPVARVPSGSA
jgi:hypothetical protein